MAVAYLNPVEDEYDGILLYTTWAEKELALQVPGCRALPKSQRGDVPAGWSGWVLPRTYAAALALRGVFAERLTVDPKLRDWSEEHFETRVRLPSYMRGLTEWPAEWPTGGGPEADDRLYQFQRVGAYFLSVAGDCILGDDMGCGKTPQALVALASLTPDHMPALVICPNSVKRHWARLARTWLPGATTYVVSGSAAKRRKVVESAAGDPGALVTVNYEAVRLLSRLAPYPGIALKRCRECDPRHGDPNLPPTRCEVHAKELNDFGFRTVIFDEIHHLADPRAKQTRACWAVAHRAGVEQRWGLTGTLFDRLEALWSLFHTVAPYDFPVKGAFMDRYMLWSWGTYGGQDVVGFNPATRDELFSFLDRHYRRMPKALVLPQLPPKVRSVRRAQLTPTQRRMYDELERDMVTILEDGRPWVVPSQLAVRTRLLQLASASVDVNLVDPDDPSTYDVALCEPAPKLDVLEEVIAELGDARFTVAAPHKKLVRLAAARLEKRGIRHAVIDGDVPEVARQVALDDLREGRIQALLFVMKAGGEGLDMSAAGTLIRIQRSWSLLENKQSEDRNHRIGSEVHESVHVIDIIAEDTLEEEQVEALNAKMANLEEVQRDKARLLSAGFAEHSPEVRQLDEVATRITATDLWDEMRRRTDAA